MRQEIGTGRRVTLEEVRRRFKQWRDGKRHRESIPSGLWEDAVELVSRHSISRISKELQLSYATLKRHVYSTHGEGVKEGTTHCGFIGFDWKASLPETECLIELEDRDGAKRKASIKGAPCDNFLRLAEVFWGRAR